MSEGALAIFNDVAASHVHVCGTEVSDSLSAALEAYKTKRCIPAGQH